MTAKNQTLETNQTPRAALSPAELCERWGVTRQTIYNMFQSDQLHSFKVRNCRLIPLVEIERIEKGEAA